MNIIVIGAGYVGLVTGACFAELGNHVVCIDVNQQKIEDLKKGMLPIYEPGLEEMVVSNMKQGRLSFYASLAEAEIIPHLIFIAVGTPSEKDGSADIQYVQEAARHIGRYLKEYCVIVDKSTVPVGMADQVQRIIYEELRFRELNIPFDVVSNPEFLREGAAIEDFMRPDRVVIGFSSEQAKSIMLDLYQPLLRNPERIYFMNVKDAEMTKYAANAMLASRISFMNELSLLCDVMGVDIENVRIGMGSDGRIGPAFLSAGCGYGGSCFPKDVRALIKMAELHGIDALLWKAVEERNNRQKQVMVEKVCTALGNEFNQKTVAVWGLSFKPGTDDMREAPSLVLIEALLKKGVKVQAYDPVAMPTVRNMIAAEWLDSGQFILAQQQYEALEDADVLALMTEWKPFCYPDLLAMRNMMRGYVVIDGRNQYDPGRMRDAGFEYLGIGR